MEFKMQPEFIAESVLPSVQGTENGECFIFISISVS